ncbi:OadG family transporter subunit [Tissierella sp.]|uniref:OadG family transporter subunit n=1 Tax=Tissierella sp. TaxID=41274 RepID=UPI00285DB173|nr:OadG family transporter subunit [Tissierella sp.]MDR7855687.1 OadG family transporter subunit [Tissierella sp.]
MGNNISFGDSLIITVFSMVVVFAALLALATLISILKNLSKERKIEATTKPSEPVKAKGVAPTELVEASNDEELVAVIAAAIAASLGVSVPDINIKSIRRVSQSTPAWAAMGRQERIYGKL